MRKFFVGSLFLFLDISVQSNGHAISLLPDFVGVLFILLGFIELSGETPRYERQKPLTVVTLVLSVAIWVLQLLGVLSQWLSIGMEVIFTVLALYLIYQMVKGFVDIEEARGLSLDTGKTLITWKLFAALQVAGVVFGWVPVLNIILIVALLVVSIMMIAAIYRTGTAYLTATRGPRGGKLPEHNGPEL